MNLERIAVRLRPRNAGEALDLGLALGRTCLKPVYAAWFAVYLPAAIVAGALFYDAPVWGWFALWWLKPFFDRVVLEALAGALFAEPVRVRTLLASLPRMAWRTGLIPALLWRRFDLARSLHLPVYQLERLSGKAARQRIRVLDREARPAAVWLTFMLVNVEMMLAVSASLVIAFLAPVQAPIDSIMQGWGRGQFSTDAGARLGALFGAAAMCAVEPFYVACGFTLYLQRRTLLEGWDIELRFRNLSARIEAARQSATAAATLGCAMIAIAVAAAWPAGAARAADAQAAESRRDPAAEIHKVLEDPQFGHEEKVKRLKYVGPEWKSSDSGSSWLDWKWLRALSNLIAHGIRYAAWSAGALLIAFALYHIARYLRLHGFFARGRKSRPDFLFGLDVRPDSLPRDVSAAAEALALEGRSREALSLLYRGALVRFLDEGIEFQHGDTEGDCTRRVDAAVSGNRRAYFRRLVASWQALAYGHRAVATGAIVALAREWRASFPGDLPPGAPEPQAA